MLGWTPTSAWSLFSVTTPQLTYQAYRQTEYWSNVTKAVKDRAGYRCQVCNSPHDLQAHHRTYDHRGRELDHLPDLICLCRRCHAIFHGQVEHSQKEDRKREKKKSAGIFTVSNANWGPENLVEITASNHKRLKFGGDCYSWLVKSGLDPTKTGWKVRAIGQKVPQEFLFYASNVSF